MRGARSSAAIGYGTRFSSHHRFVRAFVEPCRLAARKSVERAARHAVEPLSRVGSREYIVFFLFCAAVVIAAAAAALGASAGHIYVHACRAERVGLVYTRHYPGKNSAAGVRS